MIEKVKENLPILEILLVAYNAEKTIKESIHSVFNQTYLDWYLTIINDGSEDETSKIISKLVSESGFERKIKYFNFNENLGLSKRLSDFKPNLNTLFIARLDADDIWLPHKLHYQLSAFFKDPKLIVLGSSAITQKDNNKFKMGKIKCYENTLINKYLLPFKNTFVHSSLIFKKSVFNKVNGYSEEYKYAQDYQLLLKLRPYGGMRSLREPLVIISQSNNQISSKFNIEQTKCVLMAQSELKYPKIHQRISSILNNNAKPKRIRFLNLIIFSPYFFYYTFNFMISYFFKKNKVS